jgi:hypothetical protein
LVLADLNGDGRLDIVTANEGRSRPLSGGGDNYPMGAGALLPRFPRRPKDKDVGTVSILLGQPDGRFGARQDYAVGRYPTSLVVGDVTHDGYADLLIADTDFTQTSGLTLLPGQAGGRFGEAIRCPGSYLRSADLLALADLDNDGWLDVVTVGADEAGGLRVLLNKGQLPVGFRSDTTYAFPHYSPSSLHLADVTGDGRLDALVTNGEGYAPDSAVVVLAGLAGGRFGPAREYPMEWGPTALGDLDGDGNPEVVSASAYAVTIRRAHAQGLGPAVRHAGVGHKVYTSRLTDVTGDGQLDLVLLYYPLDLDALGMVAVLPGRKGGGFGAAQTHPMGTFSLEHLAVGDVTGDGRLDLVALDRNLRTVYVVPSK